jgi:pyrroline-5-carboxylate reductase
VSEKIAFIGAGMMGGAIIRSLIKSGYQGGITAADFQSEKLREFQGLDVAVTADNRQAAESADIVFLGIKPGDVKKVLEEIKKEVAGKLVISMAATVPLWFLKKTVPEARIVRIMPNLAALVQASYTAFCCEVDVTKQEKQKIKDLLSLIGLVEEVDEKYMDAITGLSGSGPGYLSIIAEALIYAGLKTGLPRPIAENAAAQNMLGVAKLILELHLNPGKIRDMVTTPGGTTIEAIYELEGSDVRHAIMRAVEQATKKSALIREKITQEKQ